MLINVEQWATDLLDFGHGLAGFISRLLKLWIYFPIYLDMSQTFWAQGHIYLGLFTITSGSIALLPALFIPFSWYADSLTPNNYCLAGLEVAGIDLGTFL